MNSLTVVSAILHNRRGQVLLQLRDRKPELLFPNHWTLFGGAAEPGETPERAMQRELLEEIEIKPALVFWKTYICPIHTQPKVLQVQQFVYLAEINTPREQLRLHEGQAMRFFNPHEINKLAIAYGFLPLIREFWESKIHDYYRTNRG